MALQVSSTSASQVRLSPPSTEEKRQLIPSPFVRTTESSGLKAQSSKVFAKDQMPGGSQRANQTALLSLQVYAHGQMANSALGMQLPVNYNFRGKEHEVFMRNEDNKLTFYCPSLQRPFSSPNILSLRLQREPHFGHNLTMDHPFVSQLAHQAMQSLEMHFGPREDPNFQLQAPNNLAVTPTPANNTAVIRGPNGHVLLGPRPALPTDPVARL